MTPHIIERQRGAPTPDTAVPSHENILALSLILVLGGFGVYGAGLGLSSHDDSRAIMELSVPAILQGTYAPSRSLGNPLYEGMAALLYGVTGLVIAINTYSVLSSLIALLLFWRLLAQSLPLQRKTIALSGFALHPLVLINSSTVIEWMQMTVLLVAQLYCSRAWLDHRRHAALAGQALASALLVLTRPDAVFFCAALVVALAWQTGFQRRSTVQLLVASGIAATLTAAIYTGLHHGLDFVFSFVVTKDPLFRRLVVAAVSLTDLFQLPGLLVLTAFTIGLARRTVATNRPDLSFWGRLFLVACPFLLVRLVWQPDKLEYMLPLLVVSLLAVAHERMSVPWAAVISLSAVSASAVSVSVFERDPGQDRLRIVLRVNRGAIAQDWQITRHYHLVTSDRFLQHLADRIYKGEPAPQPRLSAPIHWIGLRSDANDLIIGEEQLYRLDNSRFSFPMYNRSRYRRVYVCDGSLLTIKPGWRLLQRAARLPAIDPATGLPGLHCSLEPRPPVKFRP